MLAVEGTKLTKRNKLEQRPRTGPWGAGSLRRAGDEGGARGESGRAQPGATLPETVGTTVIHLSCTASVDIRAAVFFSTFQILDF